MTKRSVFLIVHFRLPFVKQSLRTLPQQTGRLHNVLQFGTIPMSNLCPKRGIRCRFRKKGGSFWRTYNCFIVFSHFGSFLLRSWRLLFAVGINEQQNAPVNVVSPRKHCFYGLCWVAASDFGLGCSIFGTKPNTGILFGVSLPFLCCKLHLLCFCCSRFLSICKTHSNEKAVIYWRNDI